jgi:hypothetical protein
MAKDSWRARSWADKWRVWFKHPGWRPADVAQRWPKPAFDLTRVEVFDPQMSRAAAWLAGALFIALLGATTGFLWFAHRLTWTEKGLAALAIFAMLWAIGWVCERDARPSVFSRESGLPGLRPRQD